MGSFLYRLWKIPRALQTAQDDVKEQPKLTRNLSYNTTRLIQRQRADWYERTRDNTGEPKTRSPCFGRLPYGLWMYSTVSALGPQDRKQSLAIRQYDSAPKASIPGCISEKPRVLREDMYYNIRKAEPFLSEQLTWLNRVLEAFCDAQAILARHSISYHDLVHT